MLFKKKAPTYTFSDQYLQNRLFAERISQCAILKTNLVVASYYMSCDPETAKYRGRVFCIDGKDKRFPALTDEALSCNLSYDPFIYGSSIFDVNGKKADPIAYSNRPFVDDRTAKEIKQYNDMIKQEQLQIKLRDDYEWLQRELPHLAPKSLSAFSRIKNAKTASFVALQKEALQKGRKL